LKLEEKVEANITEIISNLGFEIEYVEFLKERDQTILRIVIDKLNSHINIEDCEKVSRAIEEVVDTLVSFEYILEVSSPGLERQLKNIKLYKKYINSEIYVKLYKKIELGKELVGILVSTDDENLNITLKVSDNDIVINIKDIANAYTTYDFNSRFMENDKKDKIGKVNLNKLSKF
jgi:ribosome maturation factor RimP